MATGGNPVRYDIFYLVQYLLDIKAKFIPLVNCRDEATTQSTFWGTPTFYLESSTTQHHYTVSLHFNRVGHSINEQERLRRLIK